MARGLNWLGRSAQVVQVFKGGGSIGTKLG
jgi:hypothetical protein